MATDKKITELPAATVPLAGTEKAEIVQGGVNKQVDVSELGSGVETIVAGSNVTVDATDPANPIVSASGGGGGTWGSITGTLSSQTDLQSALDAKAPLASPTFTGTPAAPTAAGGTNTTQVATTAFVVAEITSKAPKVIQLACSDEVTPITATTNKIKFRMPYAMTLTAVRASLSTTQTSGSIFTVDINEAGSTILSTKITIDNGETTSTTAATPPVISDTALADDAEISIDVDQIGDNTAKGLKVTLIGS